MEEEIPWKKELIERRKNNQSKTSNGSPSPNSSPKKGNFAFILLLF